MGEPIIEQSIKEAVREAMESEILPMIRKIEKIANKNREIIDQCLCDPCKQNLSCEKRRLQG